jgi:hypothetical protein
MRSLVLASLLFGILTGCTHYEHQEDLYFEVDGSGEVRVSCSEDLFTLLYGIDGSLDIPNLTEFLESPDLQVSSIRRSRRQGRGFLHIRARFEDLERLSDQAVFQGRRYQLAAGEEYLDLRVDIRDGRGRGKSERLQDGLFRFRVHFPSPVRRHNSDTGVERGNIITWERSVADQLRGEPLHVEARFDRRTVLATALILLAIALSVVVLVISASLFIFVRIGRRQLAARSDDH